jgi:hypothetical protein
MHRRKLVETGKIAAKVGCFEELRDARAMQVCLQYCARSA